jgi:hypothetical protein
MKKLATILAFLIVFTPMAAYTEGRITKIPYAGLLTSGLDPAQTHKVPFPGILLDAEAWATIQTQKELHKKELELKDLEKLRFQIKKEGEISLLKIEHKFTVKTYKERIGIKDKYTLRLENLIEKDKDSINWVPWAFVGGVVVGALATIAIVFAVGDSN